MVRILGKEVGWVKLDFSRRTMEWQTQFQGQDRVG